ncbi:homeobox-domain-containing protein [Backusella circina FSU 941]|nr:homeobox-domain-containing protein [Backusella circina FSU 941]
MNSSTLLDIANLLSSPQNEEPSIKAKRKRASPNQLVVLNRIFNQTYFPSTEIRVQLGKQLGMSPRAVQIWFQNKRQALRARGRQASDSSSVYLPPLSPPRSPPDLSNHKKNHYFSWGESDLSLRFIVDAF